MYAVALKPTLDPKILGSNFSRRVQSRTITMVACWRTDRGYKKFTSRAVNEGAFKTAVYADEGVYGHASRGPFCLIAVYNCYYSPSSFSMSPSFLTLVIIRMLSKKSPGLSGFPGYRKPGDRKPGNCGFWRFPLISNHPCALFCSHERVSAPHSRPSFPPNSPRSHAT